MQLIKISVSGYKNDSPDRYNDYNVIMSGVITMDKVDHPVVAMDDRGSIKVMMPGSKHSFGGELVIEVPLRNDELNFMSQDDIMQLVRSKAKEVGFI